MAAFPVSSFAEGQVVDKEYCCSICEKHNTETNAAFYCKKCNTFFCGQCIHSHSKHGLWFNKQSPYGKDKIMKWPISKKMENYLLACDIHKNEKLTKFCQNHSRLCCSKCVDLDHSRCTPVKVISKVKRQSSDVKKLSVKVLKTLSRLKKLQGYREDSRRSMQVCYAELEQNMVETMQLNIQSFLVQCEDNSVNETHAHVEYSVDEMRQKIYSLLAEFENSAIKENKEELTLKQAPLLSVINTCIRHHIELLRVYEALRKVKDRTELSLITRYKCQDKIQQSEIYMNENFSDEVFTIQGKSTHNVRMSSDSKTCWITAMLVLPDGQFLVADWGNHKVKLLNQQYQVVSHCGVSAQSICQITPSEVAVTVDDWINTHEVQFITFNQSQLVTGRHFQLQHDCYGIAHHQGDLFICSGNAMFKYSLSGELICKLYEDASGFVTVWGFAMSHTGDKLYITSPSHHKLYTVARDGTLLAVFTDPELQYPQNVYVTPAGQVLVCGMLSHTIVQMDSEGKRKLATLVSVRDGVGRPCSVCYSSTTSSIIVGLLGDDNIMVFRVE